MYFTLINDILLDSKVELNPPKDLPVELDFMGGNLITFPIETPMVFTTNAKEGDEIRDFHKSSFPIMSKRILELFQGAGVDNLQVFPIIIKSEVDGYVWKDYFGVNVLGVIACADLSLSTYTEIMPGHYRFRELAIDKKKVGDFLMFRLHEHLPTIIMHKSVGKYIVDNDPHEKLTGWDAGDIIQ